MESATKSDFDINSVVGVRRGTEYPPGFHADHVGQVTSFPKATLLIGKGLLQQAAAPCAEAMPLRLLRLHNTCDARTCNAYYRLLMSGDLRQCEACGAFWGRPQEEETFSSYG